MAQKKEVEEYKNIHNWVRQRKIKPLSCPRCNKHKRLELANISGEYNRDINDFEYLCKSCHKQKYHTYLSKVPIGFKICGTCKKILPLSSFYIMTKAWDGLSGKCKDCYHIYNIIYQNNIRKDLKINSIG